MKKAKLAASPDSEYMKKVAKAAPAEDKNPGPFDFFDWFTFEKYGYLATVSWTTRNTKAKIPGGLKRSLKATLIQFYLGFGKPKAKVRLEFETGYKIFSFLLL